MAKIQGTSRLLVNEFPDQKDWIGRLFDPLNQSLDSLFGALRGKLTYQDNLYCNVKEIEIAHGQSISNISHSLVKVSGVILIKGIDSSNTNNAVTVFHWWTVNNNNIGVYVEFKGAGTTSGKIKIRIEGE